MDLDWDWPGSTHDARIWAWSDMRHFLDSEPEFFFFMAGDSAYPISPILIKPYPNGDAAQDPSVRLFNSRLSGLRTVMSENVFARLKQQFPVLRNMRAHLPSSKVIILAVAILHNVSVRHREVQPEDDEDILEPLREIILQMEAEVQVNPREEEWAAELAVRGAGVPAVNDPIRRAQAQHIRNGLRANVPQPCGGRR